MKKLMLVVLFVAVPALVLAQTPTGTTKPVEVKKSEVTTKAPETAKEVVKAETKNVGTTATTKTADVAKSETKKVETAAVTKTTETKSATEPAKAAIDVLLNGDLNDGEKVTIEDRDANNRFSLKMHSNGKVEKVKVKETYVTPNFVTKTATVKATAKKNAAGEWEVEKFEQIVK